MEQLASRYNKPMTSTQGPIIPRICASPFSTHLGRGAAVAVWALATACNGDGPASDGAPIAMVVTPHQLSVVQGQGSSRSAMITVTWNDAAAGDVAIEVQPEFDGNAFPASGMTFSVIPRVLTPSEPATTIEVTVETWTALGSYPFVIKAIAAGVEPVTSQLVMNVGAPGPPAQLRMYPLNNSPVLTDSTLSVSAHVVDSEGNVLRGQLVEWAVESGGGSLDSVISTTGSSRPDGTAANIWHLGAVEGEQAILLRVQGSSIAQRYVVRAFDRLELNVSSLPPTSPAGSAMPIAIRLVSSTDVPVPRVQIKLQTRAGNDHSAQWVCFCPLTFPDLTNPDDSFVDADGNYYVFTDANGEVKAVWHAPTQILAGAADLALTLSTNPVVVHQATVARTSVVPGPAAILTIVAGDHQTGAGGQPLPFPLAVKATDQFGNSTPNAVVTWTASEGGSFLTPTAVTGADGVARNTWTLATVAGTQTATAALSPSITVSFLASATQ